MGGRLWSESEWLFRAGMVVLCAACTNGPEHRDAHVVPDHMERAADGAVSDEGRADCPDSAPHFSGIECWQCIEHEDCAKLDPGLFCLAGTCADVSECKYCVEPAPVCVRSQGVLSCRDCLDDSWCKSVSCDKANNLCDYAFDPGDASFGCTSDEDCGNVVNYRGDLHLACDIARGACYDLNGWCGGGADCPSGSSCRGMAAFKAELEAVKHALSSNIVNDKEGFCECNTPFMDIADRKNDAKYIMDFCTYDERACVSEECYSGICVNIRSLATVLGKDSFEIPNANICILPLTLMYLLLLDE